MDQKEQQLALMERFRMAYARQDRDELLATTTSDFIWQQHDADTVDDLPAGRVLQGVDALLLRASSELDGVEVDLAAVTGTAASGVEGGEALTAFVDAVMTRDEVAITDARGKVEAQLGAPALIDAAAVLANFQRMVRIADPTGIPLDAPVQLLTQDIREDLGINAFGSAGRSPALSWPKRTLGRLLAPFAPKLLKRMTARRGGRPT